VRGKTFVRCDKALPSYLVLIPLIYIRFHFPHVWRQSRDVVQYLLRASLSGSFSGTPDQLIDDVVKELRATQTFDVNQVFGTIRSQNRSLEITEDRLWSMGYGSNNVHLLFNLWYRDFNYTPAYENNLPQVDHIFPQSLLRKVKRLNPESGRLNLMRYHEAERNQLANCMLLTAAENGAGGKAELAPEEWFIGDRGGESYLDMHLIPKDPALWKLERFEDFIEERKKLIAEKFKWLLAPIGQQLEQMNSSVRGTGPAEKSISALIGDSLLRDGEELYLKYKERVYTGTVRQGGIELRDGSISSPSRAALRCYNESGSPRPSENGWRVWKNSSGKTLEELYAAVQRPIFTTEIAGELDF
jgi:hypothetical protein